jgi:iron complex transport system ATP-binding protein
MNHQPAKPYLEAQTLSCSYGANSRQSVLQGVNLSLHPGELVGLIGPNGAGKTTLLRALSRLLRPDRGQVLLKGRDIWQLSPRQVARQIGRVPQTANAAWPYPVEQVVQMGRFPHHSWLTPLNGQDAAIVDIVMTRLELQPLRQRTLDTLSGGEQQRVLIARALAQQPAILLLDEPIANLDINHQHQVLGLIQDLAQTSRLAIFMAIHDLELAARYCHRLILLHQGQIWAAGQPADVLKDSHMEAVFGVESRLYRDPLGHWALMVHSLPQNGGAVAELPPKFDRG